MAAQDSTRAPLVGRADEFARALAALGGGSGLLAVAGPPGIGKSRLLSELQATSAAEGVLVLTGRASEFERDLPFAAWNDALDGLLGSLDTSEVAALGEDGVADQLASVFPALSSARATTGPPVRVDERHRLHAAVRTLLERLGGRQRLLLVLDDLHWGDESSIDLIASLLRRPPAESVAIAVAFRPAQIAPTLAATLARAERDGGLTRVTLDVLGATECDELLAATVPAELREALREESGGNPFYLEQLSRTAGNGDVPQGVVAAILEELRALPAAAARVLDGASVVGDPFDSTLAAAAAQTSPAETAEAIDELARRDLVHAHDGVRLFTMRHPLVRRAVYEATGPAWRLHAHGRVLAALKERGASSVLLAHHVARSAEPGDHEAIALLETGAAAVADRSPAVAADWLGAALELLDGGQAEPAERVRILKPLSAALAAKGDVTLAYDVLRAAIDLVPASDVTQRTELVTRCVSLEHRLGHFEVAHQRLLEVLASLPTDHTAEHLPVLVELIADAFHRTDLVTMLARADETIMLADDLDDPLHRFAGLAARSLAHVMFDDTAEGARCWDAANELVVALTDAELAGGLDGIHFLTWAGMYLERFEAMNEHAARGIRVARASGQGALIPVFSLARGNGLTLLGRIEEARAVLDVAAEAARVSRSPSSLAWVLMNSALTELTAGDLSAAVALAEEGMEISADIEDNFATAQLGNVLGEALFASGNVGEGVSLFRRSNGGPEIPTAFGSWRCYAYDVSVRMHLAQGEHVLAAEAADRSSAHAAKLGLRVGLGWSERSQAAVHLAAGDAGTALDLAASSAERLSAGATPVESARASVLAARALGAAGRKPEAVTLLKTSIDVLAGCGALGYAEEASKELRRFGGRTVRGVDGAEGVAALSGREREIAELVASGQTNNEVAAALYLSPKTVESHLRNVFAKLRVSSRVEVARAIYRDEDGVQ